MRITSIHQAELLPTSMSLKAKKMRISTPKMMAALRNCLQPLLKWPKVSMVTVPAARYITNSSIPLPQKMSSGSRVTM